jgi:hypothetical protein
VEEPVTLVGEFYSPGEKGPNLLVRQINALLFHELAQFVVWGERNKELVVAHPDLAALLQSAELTLSTGGLLDISDSSPRAD